LTLGFVVAVPVSSANAHSAIASDNIAASNGTVNASLFVATKIASSAVSHSGVSASSGHADARSTGLYLKDTSSGTAQTATVVAGGVLSLYAQVSTTVAVSATPGTNSGAGTVATSTAYGVQQVSISSTASVGATAMAFSGATPAGGATAIALLWTAPTTSGTVTIEFRRYANTGGTAIPTAVNPLLGTQGAVITVEVLPAGNLSSTHNSAGSTLNNAVSSAPVNSSLLVATASNTGGAAVGVSIQPTVSSSSIYDATISVGARSVGLLYKDTTFGSAQSATVLAGAVLSLYAPVTTTVAFNASAGSFSGATSTATITYSDPARTALHVFSSADSTLATTLGATAVATLWTAPSTAGTYSIALYKQAGTNSVPSLDAPTSGSLAGLITVTVAAASAGGTYSAGNSACVTKTSVTASSLTSAESTSSSVAAENPWYIGFLLNDAYGADLSAGSLVASATNGALVALTTDGSALAAGSGTTAVATDKGESDLVRIDAKTAGVPQTTTVTISHNGTVVCTKTVTFRGYAASMEVSKVATVDLGGAVTNSKWLGEAAADGGIGLFATTQSTAREGHFYMVLKDSAGNIVTPTSSDTFAIDSSTVTSTVTSAGSTYAATTNPFATSTTSTSAASKTVGVFTCGASAGSAQIKMVHTSAATGTKVTSPAFTARCADDPYSFTASWDKATYTAGDVATLTLTFKDSKGNAANSVDAPGAHVITAPLLTAVSTTGSAVALTDTNGVIKYTYTVGVTAGSYAAIIDFTALDQKETASYKITTGGDTTTNADILKSIVALIASINKQIQALQKLILKR